MFNKYFRHYPTWLQIVLYLMLVLTIVSTISILLQILMPKLVGVDLATIGLIDKNSPRELVNYSLIVQMLVHIGAFLLPAIIFAYWTHPKIGYYLGLRAPGKRNHTAIVLLIMAGFIPTVLFLEGSIRQYVPIPESFKEMQAANDRLIEVYLTNENLGQFLLSFLVMAIVPAIGEEMMFRGILMRFLSRSKLGIHYAIGLSSLMFSLMHPNPIGYIAIFGAGLLLAFIYYWTGSLWMAILAHLINNGVQVAMIGLSGYIPQLKSIAEAEQVPVWVGIMGIIITTLGIWLLYKNRTPLPTDWNNDFKEELELKEASSRNN